MPPKISAASPVADLKSEIRKKPEIRAQLTTEEVQPAAGLENRASLNK